MSAVEPWPTEAMATRAVDVAARAAFEASREELRAILPPRSFENLSDWEDIGPVVQLQWRERVRPLIWAALSDLPDPRHAAWNEGHYVGYAEAVRDDGGDTPNGVSFDNPYPSGI